MNQAPPDHAQNSRISLRLVLRVLGLIHVWIVGVFNLITPVDSHAGDPLSGQPDAGFISLFDGRSLQGWATPEPGYWSIDDGAITGRITQQHPCTVNQYLVWTGNETALDGELADFELKLKSRLNGRGSINSGFQFRSRLLPDHDMAGYQVDYNLQTEWLVRLYDEFGRHKLANRGEQTTFDETGKRNTVKIEAAQGRAKFNLEEWHEYHLICVGNKLTLKVNGELAAEVIDRDPRRQDLQGRLGLQLHSGAETVVQFKEIQLKILKRAEAAAAPLLTRRERDREKLLAGAFARWDMGAGGHGSKFPLRHAADFYGVEFDVRAIGNGARPGARVCLFHGGCFAGPRDFPTDQAEWTYYLRYYQQPNVTRGTLLAKGPAGDSPMTISTQLADWQPPPRGGRAVQRMEVEVQTSKVAGDAPRKINLEDDSGDQWVDLILVRRGKRDTYFLRPLGNDESRTLDDATPLLRNQQPLGIGGVLSSKPPQDLFQGEVEEIAVWSRALTDEEISTLSPAEERPAAPPIRRPRFRRRRGPMANIEHAQPTRQTAVER